MRKRAFRRPVGGELVRNIKTMGDAGAEGGVCTKRPESGRANEKVEERKWVAPDDPPFTSNLRFLQMTKYTIRPKFSSAPFRSPKFHATRPAAQPFLKPRQRLRAIRDAPQESEDIAFYRRLNSYKEHDDAVHRHQNVLANDEGPDWADESTLIAMLQDNDSQEDGDCDVADLLDRLNNAMVAYRPGLRDYLRNTLIPTVHHQTRLRDALREKIDTSFATGILSIDQVCKNVELFRLKDEDDTTNFHSAVKVKVGQIQTQIAAAEAERQRIIEAFKREVTKRLNAIASIGEGLPAHGENLLSKLEKKCKDQEKETPDLEKSVAALLKLQMN
ncbi:hypothetical protein BJ322DRAFT_14169 [Thelephora terrestris]|uniref:Uncharacterized protein n=1 Tax=Thelephora terrestris TaxID=56493 RepID=A0A9P6HNY8_9AGAM|nr:hypothetical protein BJ322DRAFT_14169 [Thelephora terrestris]